MERVAIAVDFDGTITLNEENFPKCEYPNSWLIEELIKLQEKGIRLILFTLREGENLAGAVEFCKRYGLTFDAVNDNLPERIEKWKCNPRKIAADYYVDNRNLTVNDLFNMIWRGDI